MSGKRAHIARLARLDALRRETVHLIERHPGLVLGSDKGKSQQQALEEYERQITATQRHLEEQRHR